MTQSTPDETWLDYEVMGGPFGDQTLVSRYLTAGNEIRLETLMIPVGTVAALIAAVLKRADQNERTDILRDECDKDTDIRLKRMTAMGRTLDPDSPLTRVIRRMDELHGP